MRGISITNMFSKDIQVSFQNTHFLKFLRNMPLILLGVAPYFTQFCPLFFRMECHKFLLWISAQDRSGLDIPVRLYGWGLRSRADT